MMKYFVLLLLLLVTLSPLHASIDCQGEGVPVGGYFGIPTEHREYELIRVDIAWLPSDEEMRYRYQEVIVVDWLNQSSTQVDLYDGALPGIVERDIREAELRSISNFSTGHLDMLFCMPDFDNFRGLVFAYYGVEGKIVKTHVVPFSYSHVDDGLWSSAVVNESISNLIVDTFNNDIVYDVTDDVERSTGVRPPRYLAESLVQQNLAPMTDLVSRDQAPLFGGHNTLVFGNQIIITGDNASVAAVHSVNNVYSNGMPIMGNDYLLTDLESHIGPISIEAKGVRRTAIIVEGRADFDATVSECVDGSRQVSAQMSYVSELDGEITLTRTDVRPRTTLVTDHHSISTELPCDARFTIDSSRGPLFGAWTDYQKDSVWFDPTESRPYSTRLIYVVKDLLMLYLGPGDVDPELIKKIWGIDDLGTLNNGLNIYTCTQAGDETVDSIDEIAANAFARLTPEELLSLEMVSPNYETHPMFDDSDGDGSICNPGELLIDSNVNYLWQIDLRVTRYLTPTQE